MRISDWSSDVCSADLIIVVGHYGCGGVLAAMDGQRHGLIDHWLRPIMDLHDRFEPDLSALPSARERLDRMCELNVQHTVLRVTQTPVVQDAWTAGHRLLVHGWVYRLEDGIIRNLECSVAGPEEARQYRDQWDTK